MTAPAPLASVLRRRLLLAGALVGLSLAGLGLWAEQRLGAAGPRHLLALDQHAGASLLDAAVARVEGEGREMQARLAEGTPAPEVLRSMMEARVRHVDDLNSLQVVLLESLDAAGRPPVLHVRRRGQQLQWRDLAAAGYDVRGRAWFEAASTAAAPRWSTPFFSDAAGGIDVVNLHLPARRDGRLVALVSVEISVERLRRLHADQSRLPMRPLAAFVADPQGRLLAASGSAARGAMTVAGLLDGFALVQGPPSVAANVQVSPEGYALVHEPVPRLGWSIGAVFEGEELGIVEPSGVLLRLAAGTIAGLLLGALASAVVARPVSALQGAVARLETRAAGEALATPLAVRQRSAEEARLDAAGSAFAEALASARTRIAEQAAEREKARHELDAARQIQTAMVPDAQVFHGRRGRLALHGELVPARAVGGDFYGFLPLGPGQCGFFLGDVSDKGIAAALFMVRVTTLLGTVARETQDLQAMLRQVSAQLMVDNEVEQFATVVFGRVDLDRGELQLASAGHEPMLLRSADGRQRWCEVATGPALGFSAGGDYPVLTVALEHGDTLVAFTDGVSEAFDPQRRAFGTEGLQVAVERAGQERIERLARAILDDVRRFADGAEQSDDITLLLMRYEDAD